MQSPIAAPEGRQLATGVNAYPLDELPWHATPRRGVKEQIVRKNNASGDYLGVVAFDPMSRTGLHQHLGVAFAYLLTGSLSDYYSRVTAGSVGINLAGATHEAVSYDGCVLVSRLDGPVIVPPSGVVMHAGATSRTFRNEKPDTPPDINVDLAGLPSLPTRFAGVTRRMIFDYAPTADDRRMVNLTLFPRCPPLQVRHTARVDFYIIAGDLLVDGKSISGPAFVTIDRDSEISLASEFGCTVLAWADGPAFSRADPEHELYGFR